MEFIDHKTNDFIILFGDHADAVALPQAPHKIFFRPRKFKTLGFDIKDIGHVPSNHPTNVNSRILSWPCRHIGLLPVPAIILHSRFICR